MSSRAERGISDRKQSEAAARDGPLRATTAGRARRRPAVHSTVAVVATRRLHCAARSGVAPHNLLRSLRSLRSNRCGESDVLMRAARADPGPALLVATDSLPTGHRLPLRHHPAMPASHVAMLMQRCVRVGCGGRPRRREAQGSWPRAQRASKHLGHETEHRRAVGAQHRPPQSSAAAGPDAPSVAEL